MGVVIHGRQSASTGIGPSGTRQELTGAPSRNVLSCAGRTAPHPRRSAGSPQTGATPVLCGSDHPPGAGMPRAKQQRRIEALCVSWGQK